jgi:hypothetical protein
VTSRALLACRCFPTAVLCTSVTEVHAEMKLQSYLLWSKFNSAARLHVPCIITVTCSMGGCQSWLAAWCLAICWASDAAAAAAAVAAAAIA